MGPCQLPGNYVVVLLIVIIVVIFAQHECLRRRFTFLSRIEKRGNLNSTTGPVISLIFTRIYFFSSWQLMEVFQNGPTGQIVVCRVALDSNYVIETVPVLLRRMEDKVVKARILQKGEYV